MGILGTMTVNFAANMQGIKAGVIDHKKLNKAALLDMVNEKPKCLTIAEVAREVALQAVEKKYKYNAQETQE